MFSENTRVFGAKGPRRLARKIFAAYEDSVATVVEGVVALWSHLEPKAFALPVRAESVLHVSPLSHKPYMLSRAMRQIGMRWSTSLCTCAPFPCVSANADTTGL